MATTAEASAIWVFCPTHKKSFNVPYTARILCEDGTHLLAQGFPSKEFWEYCCDCQRFWPSNLNHGGQSEAQCPVCSRTIARRYLCDTCKLVSVESDDAAKRKSYALTQDGGVGPECPGCSVVPAGTLRRHECDDIGVSLITPRDVCPFCEKPTSEKKVEQKIEPAPQATPRVKAIVTGPRTAKVIDRSSTAQLTATGPACRRCGTARRKPGDEFCGKCGVSYSDSSNLFDLSPTERVKEVVTPGPGPTAAVKPVGRPQVKLVLGVVGGIALIGILIAIGSSVGGNSVEKKLDRAIAAGNIFGPSRENAHDLFYELVNSGSNAETLKRYREKLTPVLTKQGYQLATDILIFGYDEPDASEWLEAARSLDWAVELNPGNTFMSSRAAYCNGRAAFVQNSKSDQALSLWTKAASLDKSWALPINGIGLIYNSKRDYASARSSFSDAIKREPNWAVPYENMGNAYYMEGQTKSRDIQQSYRSQAREFYSKAASKASSWAKPHIHLADMAAEDGDDSTAVSEFEQALRPNATGLKTPEITKAQQRLEKARQRLSGS